MEIDREWLVKLVERIVYKQFPNQYPHDNNAYEWNRTTPTHFLCDDVRECKCFSSFDDNPDWYKDEHDSYPNQYEQHSPKTYWLCDCFGACKCSSSLTHKFDNNDWYGDDFNSRSTQSKTNDSVQSNNERRPNCELKFSGLKIDHSQTSDVEYFLHQIHIYINTMASSKTP